MKYLSMFTGIGGFEIGIQKAFYFQKARELAEQSTSARKTAAIVVFDDVIIGQGSNTHTEPCKRQGFPTGVGYDLCDGCNYDNHAEANALKDIDARGADLYLYGHYYLCDLCLDKVRKAGIRNVYIKNAYVSDTPRSEQGGVDVETSRTRTEQESMALQQLSSVGYSEIDKYAVQTYEKNFGVYYEEDGSNRVNAEERSNDDRAESRTNLSDGDGGRTRTDDISSRRKGHKNYGDATTIDSTGLPDFDFLVGGFPCQSFSVAGKRGGFNDTRGTLFFDVARILKDKRPRHLVLENVKGLLSHDGGKTFSTIIGVLTDLGYSVEWQVLNSKDFGVPQNRERVYIVGHLGADCRRKIFPLRSDYEPIDELQGQQALTNTLTTRYTATGSGAYVTERELNAQKGKVKQIGQIYDNPHNSQAGRIYDKEGISPTLDVMGGGNRQPKVVVAALRGRKDKDGKYVQELEPREDGATNTLTSVHKDNVVAMRWVRTEKGKEIRREARKEGGKDYTPFNGEARTLAPSDSGIIGTITSQAISKDSLLGDGMRIRRLTPKECERLQGFPDDWTLGVSDSQRYKQCGNAVTTNVVQAVFEKLLETH